MVGGSRTGPQISKEILDIFDHVRNDHDIYMKMVILIPPSRGGVGTFAYFQVSWKISENKVASNATYLMNMYVFGS